MQKAATHMNFCEHILIQPQTFPTSICGISPMLSANVLIPSYCTEILNVFLIFPGKYWIILWFLWDMYAWAISLFLGGSKLK